MDIFRISFINHGKVYQIHAETVYQGDLYGFISISGLIFGETSALVVDPSEEKLKAEFNGVKQFSIPMHAVIRIDQVEKRGENKILELDSNSNIMTFPNSLFTPENKR